MVPMSYMQVQYSELWLASSSLNTRQSKLLIDLLARYTQASTVNPDATFPETDDVKVGAVLYPICMRIQACTVKHALRSEKNRENANARWRDKEKGKAEGAAPAPKAKGKSKAANKAEAVKAKQDAPMTFDEFKAFVGDGHNINDVRGLYDKLQNMGWVYHGHQLGEYWTKCNACYDKGCGKWCCGMFAVVVFNTLRGYKEPLRAAAFNAACDAMAAANRGLCDVGKVMSEMSTNEADGEIRYCGKRFNSVQNFAEFLNNSLRE